MQAEKPSPVGMNIWRKLSETPYVFYENCAGNRLRSMPIQPHIIHLYIMGNLWLPNRDQLHSSIEIEQHSMGVCLLAPLTARLLHPLQVPNVVQNLPATKLWSRCLIPFRHRRSLEVWALEKYSCEVEKHLKTLATLSDQKALKAQRLETL